MQRPALAFGSVLACAATLLTGCHSAGQALDHVAVRQATRAIEVSRSDCGSSWHPAAAGDQHLRLHNADTNAGEVQVLGMGAHQGLVYANIEPFGPDTTVDLQLPLSAGRYALACLMEDTAPITGPVRTITGSGNGTPGVRILTQSELVPATQRYQRWVRRQLGPLQRDTHRLRDLVESGNDRAARDAWVTAHLDYQRLGAAYDAFGDLGDAIDGLPSGLRGGTSNQQWTGFHRVERDLWGSSPGRLRDDVTVLDRAVSQLRAQVRNTELEPLTLTLRAHEIAENALQFQLTGQDDFGSHSDLESVRAGLVGTQAVLAALARPIDSRVHDAAGIRSALRRTLGTFTQAIRPGHRVPVSGLPRQSRERLDASLSLLTQRLATIPATLEPRLTVASGSIGTGGSG
jgi:iron uptake system component EfeO